MEVRRSFYRIGLYCPDLGDDSWPWHYRYDEGFTCQQRKGRVETLRQQVSVLPTRLGTSFMHGRVVLNIKWKSSNIRRWLRYLTLYYLMTTQLLF
jgi:hypothetical protein